MPDQTGAEPVEWHVLCPTCETRKQVTPSRERVSHSATWWDDERNVWWTVVPRSVRDLNFGDAVVLAFWDEVKPPTDVKLGPVLDP